MRKFNGFWNKKIIFILFSVFSPRNNPIAWPVIGPRSDKCFLQEYWEKVFINYTTVVNKTTVLFTCVNQQANLDFSAEFINTKEQETSQSDGVSHNKLLCSAYDMAVVGAYSGKQCTRFVYHDGVFENLDNRNGLTLKEVMRADENRRLQ